MSQVLIHADGSEHGRLQRTNGSRPETVVRAAFKNRRKAWGRAQDLVAECLLHAR